MNKYFTIPDFPCMPLASIQELYIYIKQLQIKYTAKQSHVWFPSLSIKHHLRHPYIKANSIAFKCRCHNYNLQLSPLSI